MGDERMKNFPFHLCASAYDYTYSYDEVKAIAELTHCQAAQELDYEDLCIIGVAIVAIWESEGLEWIYPWTKLKPHEIGYVQSYTQRTAKDFIELYNTIFGRTSSIEMAKERQ